MIESTENIVKLLTYYKRLGERTLEQLNEEEIHLEPATNANSIAIIVKHLHGNMRSRWTNFLTEDGEKPWRERDGEFEDTLRSKKELLEKWNEGWDCFLQAIRSLTKEDLQKTIYIRNEGHQVVDAIHRQLAHYSYHVGQMVYLGKLIKGEGWQSLSIPKGRSQDYNQQKFSETKADKHFTDKV